MTAVAPLFALRNFQVRFDTADGPVAAVRGVDLTLAAGQALAIVGESGSGKSQTVLGAFGLTGANSHIAGDIAFDGHDIRLLSPRQRRSLLGRDVGFVFQDPLTALTPHLPVARQIGETLERHRGFDRTAARAAAIALMTRLGLPADRADAYPHELSGGQRQRVMIASALACDPKLLIADEPTTALDVTVQAEILALLDSLRAERGLALVFITHDLAVAAQVTGRPGDQVAVMRAGRIVEQGAAEALLAAPADPYTRALAAAARPATPREAAPTPLPRLVVDGLGVNYRRPSGWFASRPVPALRDVSFTAGPGEAIGIVGESGSGKSTLIRALLGLVPTCAGTIHWQGAPLCPPYPRALRRSLQIVHQDPFAALNPRLTIGQSLAEPLEIHAPELTAGDRRARVQDWLARVGLPASFADRHPHELSGGQNQRVNIARAFIAGPALVACDEAVSALDAETKVAILDLLLGLQAETGVILLFVTHDFQSVTTLCQRTIVLHCGKIVDAGATSALMANPTQAYTRTLIAAMPRLTLPPQQAPAKREKPRET